MVESILQDLRFAWRGFVRTPGAFTVAIVAIALGIGGTTAVFSVVDRLLFRPLPYASADRLVVVGMKAPISQYEFLLEGDYFIFTKNQTVFEEMTSFSRVGDCDLNEQEPLKLTCANVAANLVPFLGVRPLLGRQFLPQEDVRGGPRAAMLSFGFWQRRFGGDPGVLGRVLQIDGRPTTVAGVLPPDFELPNFASADVLLTQQLNISPRVSYSFLTVIARLKPDISLDHARQALQPLYHESLKNVPPAFVKEVSFHVTSLKERQTRDYRTASLVLLGAVIAMLLIACANVANLLMARAASRQSEFAVRSAIGASHMRLIRQALTESVLLGAMGGLAGFLLGAFLLKVLLTFAPAGMVRLQGTVLDPRVLLFTAAVAVGCGLLFGLAPALQLPAFSAMRTARSVTRGWRVSQALVAVQVGLSVVLLSGAGLFLQSLWRMQTAPLGLNPEQLLTVRVQLGQSRYGQDTHINGFHEQALERLARIPGVQMAAMSDSVPLYGPAANMIYSVIRVEGRPAPPAQGTGGMLVQRTVTPSYFSTLGVPIVRGRAFTEEDRLGTAELVVLDEVLARRLFPGQDPVGQRIQTGTTGPWRTIVGIARPAKNAGLGQPDDPEYYNLWRTRPEFARRRAHYILRTEGEPAEISSFIRAEIARIDSTLPLTITTMNQNVRTHVDKPRLQTTMLTVFAAVGLLLAAVGQFGLISYVVTQRLSEIGIRMALGATRSDVVSLLMRRMLLWTGGGAVAGVLGAVWLGRFLEPLLYGVKARDLTNFAFVLLVLAGVSVAAVLQPSLRAARIDPAQTLRHD